MFSNELALIGKICLYIEIKKISKWHSTIHLNLTRVSYHDIILYSFLFGFFYIYHHVSEAWWARPGVYDRYCKIRYIYGLYKGGNHCKKSLTSEYILYIISRLVYKFLPKICRSWTVAFQLARSSWQLLHIIYIVHDAQPALRPLTTLKYYWVLPKISKRRSLSEGSNSKSAIQVS